VGNPPTKVTPDFRKKTPREFSSFQCAFKMRRNWAGLNAIVSLLKSRFPLSAASTPETKQKAQKANNSNDKAIQNIRIAAETSQCRIVRAFSHPRPGNQAQSRPSRPRCKAQIHTLFSPEAGAWLDGRGLLV
jgi:hypothetical protein